MYRHESALVFPYDIKKYLTHNIFLLTILYVIHYNKSEVNELDEKMIINNLEVELKRGTQTLQVLFLLKNEQYGYSLLQALEERQINIEAGTLYPLLRRLETQRMLTSNWDTSESRPRKYYVLSPFGEEVLEHLIKTWTEINDEMMKLIKGDNKQ